VKSCVANPACRGYTFNEAVIPYPTPAADDDLDIQTKPNRPSPLPNESSISPEDATAPTNNAGAPSTLDQPTTAANENTDVELDDPQAIANLAVDPQHPATYAQLAATEHDGPVALPGKIAPPEPEDEANFDEATEQLLNLESPQRPAKVVRLPVDEQDVEQDEGEQRSVDTDTTKVSKSHLQAQENASSPSSTVGGYSAATPMPPQDSPDTSPDSETGEQIEVLPPKELRPSPEQQREKEEHDRLLGAQKDIARKQALGDVSTPDEQLRWEEREAAARDAEERAAREDVGGPEPNAKRSSQETEAREVVDEVMRDREVAEAESSARNEDSKAATQASKTEQVIDATVEQDDEDTITVATRNRAGLTIDTSRTQHTPVDPPTETPADTGRMKTRTSSGILHNRSVSEILGQTPTQPDSARRTVMSPETISPMTARHPKDTPPGPLIAQDAPRRPSKQPGLPRNPADSTSALEELMVLKGAAEDPDRDYLEPLFRIQCHDSANVRTTSLTDLVRSASKTLSTEDHFLTIQERLDYRILRRIYQLQNANKWSLRQMERCKEPGPPVTHHDQMMAEMKWMRKDFKAERKMKTSVCAWLAQRCADWVAASSEERLEMQVKTRLPTFLNATPDGSDEQVPDLEQSGDSAAEEEAGPPTPKALPRALVVPPELSETVSSLQKAGKLHKALEALPVAKLATIKPPSNRSLVAASKFAQGKVLPRTPAPPRKRSRFDYEDDDELAESEPNAKRRREDRGIPPEDQESALFHPENKHIRDRLHANNAFRPPSEFQMPTTQFYEFRSGSQWIWEDDHKLRRLAKEYSFNWSLIADELQLPAVVKSSAERRTPWECFERWVELEQLPAEMRKTVYFKTWFQRLESAQQAAERRYQAHIAAMQAQNNGQSAQYPPRKKTTPGKVEKRRNMRYLWLVDAMRKGARKKEQAAYKQAEGGS
jgi:chromatin modification-related protein VID21